jgi:hypothetical protein
MTHPGRPTLYKPDYARQAHEHCLLGATNAELAAAFDVAPRTVDNWIANNAEFAHAVREGRAEADAHVARCLYERAVGYDRTVERVVLHQGQERVVTSTVHYPPNPGACIFWLRNRRPDLWGNRRPTDASADDGYDMIAELEAAGERARAALDSDEMSSG